MRNIRHLREQYGYSQRELAAEIGLTFPAIQRIEVGNADPKWSSVVRLADFFHCPSDYMMGRDEPVLYKYRTQFSDEEIQLALDFIQKIKRTSGIYIDR